MIRRASTVVPLLLAMGWAPAGRAAGASGGPPFVSHDREAPAPRLRLALRARFGVTTAPFYTESLPEVRGQGFIGTLSGAYRLAADAEVGLVLPAAALQVRQPAGAYVNELTRGNPALFAADEGIVREGSESTLRYIARLTVALPLSERGPSGSLMSNRALAIASALEGWREQELYAPGRLSIVPCVGLVYDRARISAEASLKLPVLFRLSRAALPSGTETHTVGFTPALHTSLAVRVTGWFVPALRADLVVDALPPVEQARGPTRAALVVLEPELAFRLSRHLGLAVDFMVPVAGTLAGTTYAGSLGLTALW